MQPASVIIDRIVYLASLASRPSEVDMLLDTFRGITARVDPHKPLRTQDAAILHSVEEGLKAYLTTKEKLRNFTVESLNLQLEQHFEPTGVSGKRRLYSVIGIAVGLAIVFGAGLPVTTIEQRVLIGGSVLFALLHLGGAWFFLTAFDSFRSSLRQAFLLIASGVTLLGLSLLEQPILEIFNLRDQEAVNVLFSLPVLIAASLFHLGDMKYTRLVGVKGIWSTNLPFVIMILPLIVVTWFLPDMLHQRIDVIARLTTVMSAWIMVTPISSLIALPKASKLVPELYKPPIDALYQAIWSIVVVTAYLYILRVIAGSYMKGVVAYVLFALVTAMGAMLLRAGYTFNKISRY